MEALKQRLPGILLATMIGMAGRYLSNWIPSLGGVTLAIILGFIIGNLYPLEQKYAIGIKFVEKKVLALAIMLMGLKLEMNILSELGFSSILVIILMVGTTVLAGFFIGRLFGLSKSFSLLLGVGNGICGSSAIAATAPVINGSEEEIGLSVSVVNLLGTFGIFLLPALIGLLHLSEPSSGLMIGSTLQATGHVVAAGFSIGDLVGKVATIVKMGRILMLGPVVLLFSLLMGNKESNSKSKVSIPPFIIGFLIFSIIGTLHILPDSWIDLVNLISKLLLTIAMAGVGLKIKVSSLLKQGPKAFLVGVLIFIVQLICASGLIYLFR